MIRMLSGSDLGVPRIPEAWVLEWAEQEKRVVFSFTQKGGAMEAHFAAGKESLRSVKDAISDFCEWVFWAYPACEAILAPIGRKSIERIVKKCRFIFLCECGPYQVYMLPRVIH